MQLKSTLFERFSSLGTERLALAVSGGGDSMALLALYLEYLKMNPAVPTPIVLTVHHGLRAGADEEAAFVAAFCARHGLIHRTEYCQGLADGPGLQAAARTARHEALRDAALEMGARYLLFGHTLDDQAETYLMRAKRADAPRGLASMAPATLYRRQHWFLRPLLDITRQELRHYLGESGVGFFDDPSNEDRQFERVRARTEVPKEILDEKPWVLAAELRLQEATNATNWLEETFSLRALNRAVFDCDMKRLTHEHAGRLALRVAMAMLGGRGFLPSDLALQNALESQKQFSHSGVVVRCDDGGVSICREAREAISLKLNPGAAAIFDNRLIYQNPFDVPITIFQAGRGILCDAPEVTFADGTPVSLEPEGWFVAPFDQYLPVFDFKIANAMAQKLGEAIYLPPPTRFNWL